MVDLGKSFLSDKILMDGQTRFFSFLTVVWRDNFANNKNTKYDERWLSYCVLDCFILSIYMNKETYEFFSFGYSRGRMKWFFFAENAKLLSFYLLGFKNLLLLLLTTMIHIFRVENITKPNNSKFQSKRLYICKCRKCVTVLLNSTLIHSISSKERNKNIILRKFPGFNQVECIFPVETVISCDMKWIFSSREFPELSNKNISNFVLEHFLKLWAADSLWGFHNT